jgi:hypothetical protein
MERYFFEMAGMSVEVVARAETMPERFGPLRGTDGDGGCGAADFLLDIVFEDGVEGGGFSARATGVNSFEFGMRGVFCEIDLNSGRGSLRSVRDESAVEYSMKLLFGALLARRGGGLTHAAAVSRDGKGRIFCGPPGAGKSTLAGIAAGGREAARVINDELAAAVADGDGVGSRVFALPEWAAAGTMRDAEAAGPRGVPLAAIYALSHARAGEATSFERLSGAEAAGAIFSNMRFALPAPEAIRAAMDAADALRRAVPVAGMRLSLADAPRFWEVVDEFESRG